jgi:hypothetical protein
MKYAASGTNVPSTQLAACNLFAKATTTATCGGCGRSISAIWRSTPAGCGNFPLRDLRHPAEGGFMLWVELPEQVDMVCVAKQLCRLKIQVAPGSLFSAAGKYRNCVRINCALPPTEKHKAVMVKLGEAVKVAME